jgi:hypothetical protein
MSSQDSQVKKFSQCDLPDKKHQYFSIVSSPTDSVIVDHAVVSNVNHNDNKAWLTMTFFELTKS